MTVQFTASRSYATATDPETLVPGGEAMGNLTVNASEHVEPPAGFAVSAPSRDGNVTVSIEADDPYVRFWTNFPEGPMPPQTLTAPTTELPGPGPDTVTRTIALAAVAMLLAGCTLLVGRPPRVSRSTR